MLLHPQDTVLIVSPAGRVLNAHIDNAIKILESWNLKVELGSHAKGEYHNFSGTIAERLSDLQWALDHPNAKAIFAARGGYGVIQLIDQLNWDTFQRFPKLLIGYSDICNLHPRIHRLGYTSMHALMPNSFPQNNEQHQASLSSLKQALFTPNYSLTWHDERNRESLELEAPIIGGNLSILYSLQGSSFAPDYNDKILFLEDLCEHLYHTDRMLRSLALSGVFSQIKGIIVGDFSNMKDNERPFGKSIEELFIDLGTAFKLPIIFGLKTGHSDPTLALPLGQRAKMTIEDANCSLQF